MTQFKAAVPVLPASNIARSAEFYKESVGFRIVYQAENYAVLSKDAIEIHLWAATDESWKKRQGMPPIESGAESFIAGTASCRILVDDIEWLYRQLNSKQIIHPNGHLESKWYRHREFSILDPDKNLVTFFAPMNEPDP
jgi:catechol 2,3-dioxygenase-like lactoylglutathione lyase family enzyme